MIKIFFDIVNDVVLCRFYKIYLLVLFKIMKN